MTTPVTGVFRGLWTTATLYSPGDVVISNGVEYTCRVAHTSGSTFSGQGTNWLSAADLEVSEAGAAAKLGVATLSGGTVVVSTTAVTASSRVFLTAQTSGAGAGALRVSARTAGTSFTITSTSGTDTSVVAWMIVEPLT